MIEKMKTFLVILVSKEHDMSMLAKCCNSNQEIIPELKKPARFFIYKVKQRILRQKRLAGFVFHDVNI